MLDNKVDKEKQKLAEEIANLKEQLLWYKRTYEDRSLAGLIYHRLFGKKGNKSKKQVKRNRSVVPGKNRIGKTINTAALPKNILCSIINHNFSENATRLYDLLLPYFDVAILDSGSDNPPQNAIRYGNIYYSALLNESFQFAQKGGYDYLFFICSDVYIDEADMVVMYEKICHLDFENTGIYSPSSVGGGHLFCKKQGGGGLRTVPFVEGFVFLADMRIMEQLCPVDIESNRYGWGLDIAKGFFAKELRKSCLIDDSVEVKHAEGTGYSRETAELEMATWVNSFKNKDMRSFFEEQLVQIKLESQP